LIGKSKVRVKKHGRRGRGRRGKLPGQKPVLGRQERRRNRSRVSV